MTLGEQQVKHLGDADVTYAHTYGVSLPAEWMDEPASTRHGGPHYLHERADLDRSQGWRVGTHGRQPLTEALAYIERNFQRSDLRLCEVAAAAHVSASHLAALIRRRLGCNYMTHLTRLRLEYAKLLLCATNLKIAAIAAAVGYETPAAFHSRFKQAFGETPMRFRERSLVE